MIAGIDWRAEAGRLTLRDKAFIGGAFVDAAGGETFDNISPLDGAVLAKVAAERLRKRRLGGSVAEGEKAHADEIRRLDRQACR
jgi:acyl-CoA reductase-like NAD-dependent aldehyde dehydrogenase